METIDQPLLVLDEELRVVSANQAFYRIFRLMPRKVEHQIICNLGNGMFNVPRLRELLEQILPHNTPFEEFVIDQDFPPLGRKVLVLKASRLQQEATKPARILLAIEDITERQVGQER